MSRPLRVLFYKKTISWPFQSGHDVHTFHMMRALSDGGHAIGLVTTVRPRQEALAALPLDFEMAFSNTHQEENGVVPLRRFEEHFRSYWGVPAAHVRALSTSAERFGADVVIVSGLEVLPFVCGIRGAIRIWYAADEWVLHHLSQFRLFDPPSWQNLRDAAIKGLYERTFSSHLDRAWVVSEADRRGLKWFAGLDDVDVLPNGVDAEHYQPRAVAERPLSAVFWGRLDFGPNIQALQWFCSRVWPQVRSARPTATFTIIGFKLGPEVAALGTVPGVTIKPDVDDLRDDVAAHAVAVLPFVSGHGIKNKLLEAAAMGKAIVCTPQALGGIRGNVPFLTSGRAADWPALMCKLWDEPQTTERLGRDAREWVVREHTWAAAAKLAIAGIEESLQKRRPS